MDLTLCPGFGCPVRTDCHRFTQEPDSQYQSFADFEAVPWGRDGCDYFVNEEEAADDLPRSEIVRRKSYPGLAA